MNSLYRQGADKCTRLFRVETLKSDELRNYKRLMFVEHNGADCYRIARNDTES